MKHFILASHAYFAKGLKTSAEMIVGEREDLSYYCAYVDENDDWFGLIEKEINSYDDKDDVILMTDVFGGSVNNELLKFIKRKNLYLVSGTNLPLVLQLLTYPESERNTEEIILECINMARDNIMLCNNIINDNEDELEDF